MFKVRRGTTLPYSDTQRILTVYNLGFVGMNVLSAPFLYTLPTQIEAFACFSTFIEKHCPLYVQRDLRGVHRGLEVSDQVSA